MKRAEQTIQTGDHLVPMGTSSAMEIDKVLTQLSQLYLERFRTLRTGDHNDLQLITDKISALKARLNQL